MSSAVAPLKLPRFRWLWAANILSASGSFIQMVAGAWLMLELTGSNTWVGWMVASPTLPLLFFSLAAGALADMFSRTKLMLIAQLIMGCSAATMAALTFADLINPQILLGLGLLLGAGLALNLPAWHALVPDLVPRYMVASAVALNSAAFNAARAVGPAVGGLVIAGYGAAAGFAVNSATYAAMIAVLAVVGSQLSARDRDPASIGSAISQGVRFARFTPPFSRLLTLTAFFAVTSASIQALLPSRTEGLGGGAAMLGALLGAMGAGALIGAFARPALMRLIKGSSIPYTITAFGASGILLGLAGAPAVAAAAMVLVGFFWLLTLSTLNAAAQLMAPEWIRGRAMSLYMLAFAGILPVGSILSGMVADRVGAGAALVVFCSGALVLGAVSPRFRTPRIDDIRAPEFTGAKRRGPHVDETALEGGPVIVLNTWRIDQGDFAEFTNRMNDIRLVRLSTGAYRWRLFRHTSDPTRLTEMFLVESWEEHLAQHSRIDDAAAALIGEARELDQTGDPTSRHLIAIDVENPPDFDEMLAAHDEMHRTDGSIPDQGL